MTTIITEVYNAFRSIGVSDEAALKAAAAMTTPADSRLTKIENRLDDVEGRLSRVEAQGETLKWMVGTNLAISLLSIAGTLAVLWRMAGH